MVISSRHLMRMIGVSISSHLRGHRRLHLRPARPPARQRWHPAVAPLAYGSARDKTSHDPVACCVSCCSLRLPSCPSLYLLFCALCMLSRSSTLAVRYLFTVVVPKERVGNTPCPCARPHAPRGSPRGLCRRRALREWHLAPYIKPLRPHA